MLRQTFRWNWPITLYMQVVILYCMIYSCFSQQYRFTTQPMYAAVTEGETASMQCEWEPNLLPGHTLTWKFFKGSEVKTVEMSTKYTLLIKANSSTLSIASFSGSDVGGYRCEIRSQPVEFSNVARVSMLTCTPKTDEGDLGGTLECSSTLDTVSIQWFRNGDPLDESQHTSTTKILTSEDVSVEFTCRATYDRLEIGRCTTTPLPIDARIEKTPPGSIQVGTKFNLTCLVNGDRDKYDYCWMVGTTLIDASTNKKYFKLGDERNVLVFSDVETKYDGQTVSCTVNANRTRDIASFIIELSTTTIPPSLYTNQLPQSTSLKSQSTSPATDIYQRQNTSSTTTIVIAVIALIVVIFATILVIGLLAMRRKKQYKNVTKQESVPLEDSSYVAIKERHTRTESRHLSEKTPEKDPIREQLILDSTVYHEPRALKSQSKADLNNSENLYAEPAMPADDIDRQCGSSHSVIYDTPPRKTVSLDNLDDPSKQGTSLSIEKMNELYAKSNKTLSKESIDAMYAKPDKTPSRESIDELYSKPNKSATKTPKSSHKDPTQKNLEGLTYADIEFQNGTLPSPDPKDYGLEYASVQFNN